MVVKRNRLVGIRTVSILIVLIFGFQSLSVSTQAGNLNQYTQDADETTGITGFESIIVIGAIALAMFLWKKKRKI